MGALRAWLPAGTTLAALVAVTTYFLTARKERRFRSEDKIAANIESLVDFVLDDSAGIGKLYTAFNNLNAIGALVGRGSRRTLRHRVAEAICNVVSYDLAFKTARDVRFDAIALDSWAYYRELLSVQLRAREGILYRYIDALQNLANENPESVPYCPKARERAVPLLLTCSRSSAAVF